MELKALLGRGAGCCKGELVSAESDLRNYPAQCCWHRFASPSWRGHSPDLGPSVCKADARPMSCTRIASVNCRGGVEEKHISPPLPSPPLLECFHLLRRSWGKGCIMSETVHLCQLRLPHCVNNDHFGHVQPPRWPIAWNGAHTTHTPISPMHCLHLCHPYSDRYSWHRRGNACTCRPASDGQWLEFQHRWVAAQALTIEEPLVGAQG